MGEEHDSTTKGDVYESVEQGEVIIWGICRGYNRGDLRRPFNTEIIFGWNKRYCSSTTTTAVSQMNRTIYPKPSGDVMGYNVL